MSYPIETRLCSKNAWFTPQEARNYYGSYARQGITVHWWGDGTGADNHDNIVSFFLSQALDGKKSVNYVVSDNKITKMVEPDNVAWTSQSGNPVTISIEFQPTLTDEGYKRGGWLIAELEKQYGELTLYPHKFWFPTACPGTINIDRLRSEADKGDDMLTQSNKDKLMKMAKLAPPTAAELGDPTYDDANRAINDFWEAYGKHNYAEAQKPKKYVKVSELYIRTDK